MVGKMHKTATKMSEESSLKSTAELTHIHGSTVSEVHGVTSRSYGKQFPTRGVTLERPRPVLDRNKNSPGNQRSFINIGRLSSIGLS